MDNLKRTNHDIDDCVKSYMNSIKKYTSLKKEEERKLIERYKKKNDIEARNTLITSNLKYACKLAAKYRDRGVPFSSLISEANDALIYAIKKFDLNKDVKLISYAKWWIKRYLFKVTDGNEELKEDELPTESNDQLLDDNINYSQEYQVKDSYDNTAFFDEEKNEEIVDENYLLDKLYETLSEREITIINMRYGRPPYEQECTLEEIGEKLKLTKERVRQILEKAKTKMRSQAMLMDCNFLTK